MNMPKIPNPRKRRNTEADLNQKPRKRQKMKRHRPKVCDPSKPKKVVKSQGLNPSTPKPRTPKRAIPSPSPLEKEQYVRKSCLKSLADTSKVADMEAISKSFTNAEESCKQKLDFDLVDNEQRKEDFPVSKISSVLHGDSAYSDSGHGVGTLRNSLNDIWEGQADCSPKSGSDKKFRPVKNLNHQQGEEPLKETPDFALANVFYTSDFDLKLEPQDFDSCPGIMQIVQKYHRRQKSLRKLKPKGEYEAYSEPHDHNDVKDQLEVDAKLQSGCGTSSLRVYRRISRCLRTSRKEGLVFPVSCKKARMQRQRAMVFDKFIIVEVSNKHSGKMVPCVRKQTTSCNQACRGNRKTMEGVSMVLTKKINATTNDPTSFDCAANLPSMMINKKKRSQVLERRQKSLLAYPSLEERDREEDKHKNVLLPEEKLKRKRSKTYTRRRDLSSLTINHCQRELIGSFLVKSSSSRTQNSEYGTFAAYVDVQDTPHLAANNFIGQLERSCDNIDSCCKSIEECPTEFENNKMINIERGLPENNVEIHMLNYPLATDQCFVARSMDEKALVVNNMADLHDVPVCVQPLENTMLPSVGNSGESDIVPHSFIAPRTKVKFTSKRNGALSTKSLIRSVTKKLESLHIDDENEGKQLVVRGQKANGGVSHFKGKLDLVKKRDPQPKVHLDPETNRMWNRLMGYSGGESTEDNDNAKYWEGEQKIARERMTLFLAYMHLILGDRRFKEWKTSVVDSVIGVFLTQNVSDNLSSSAFMNLAARFPPVPVNEHDGCDGNNLSSQGSVCLRDSLGDDCTVHEVDEPGIQELNIDELSSEKCQVPVIVQTTPSSFHNHVEVESSSGKNASSQFESIPGRKKRKIKGMQETPTDWDELRRTYSKGKPRRIPIDSVNWEVVRQAPVEEVAELIRVRGMNNILAKKIKDFLDRLVEDHGSIDLEWLRDFPPDKAKEYLLSIYGIGLKSVECVRLLTLHHHAFPVDTNIGRVLVRLGWVPLQPLPEDVLIHLLNTYPLVDTIQKYIWPRLCNVDKLTLYEFHYHLITFGKIFCTKKQPNCNACPMRGECRHFASAFASARLRLQDSQKNTAAEHPPPSDLVSVNHIYPPLISQADGDLLEDRSKSSNSEPIVEIPASPEPTPAETLENDIEDYVCESEDEIPVIRLNAEKFIESVLDFMENTGSLSEEEGKSKALVTVRPEAASIPVPKLKSVSRLRTEHQVYELPDSHPLLEKLQLGKRVPDDDCPYLLAIWMSDHETDSSKTSNNSCLSNRPTPCGISACCSRDSLQCGDDQIVKGSILIPCRTANKGCFPLNGTYFQVNEVFADHESSQHPIDVPRKWIWNLRRRTLYCGTSATSIFRGFSMEETQYAFWKGFICVRGFERKTGAPRPLGSKFHTTLSRSMDD